MPSHGGRRPGAGRKPRADGPATSEIWVKVTDSERAELLGGLREGETLAGFLREHGLAAMRRRKQTG